MKKLWFYLYVVVMLACFSIWVKNHVVEADTQPGMMTQLPTTPKLMPPTPLNAVIASMAVMGLTCDAPARGSYIGWDTMDNPVFFIDCSHDKSYLVAVAAMHAIYVAGCNESVEKEAMCLRARAVAGF